MKKGYSVIVAMLVLVGGFFLYSSKAGFGQKNEGIHQQPSQQAKPSAGHQGHTNEGEQPKSRPEAARQPQAEEAPTIEIPPDKQQLIGVKTVAVTVRPLQKVIRTVGRVEYDERRLATVNTKVEGWIEKLHVDYTGRQVRKGEPLAEIYSPELIATQQEFLNVLRWARQSGNTKNENIRKMLTADADSIINGARQRLRLWDISDEQIKKIEESEKPIRTLTIYSPVDGYVVQKMAVQGMRVMPGEKLFDVADLTTLWVVADLYEYELPLVTVGQKARITLSYFPGREILSTIEYVYPALSGETRTAKVRFSVPNPGGQVKPQMLTNVELKIDMGKRLAVPDDAVIDTGTRQVVYVDRGEGNFEPREVLLGLRTEGFREVIQGLRAGEKVAASATFLIDAEAQLKNVTPLSGHKH